MPVTADLPQIGPCAPWTTADALCDSADTADADLVEQVIEAASELLFAKSARVYSGTCSGVLRPCCASDLCGRSRLSFEKWADGYGLIVGDPFPFTPELFAGQWYNVAGCASPCVAWDCSKRVPRVDLGRYPVTQVTEVKIDGVVLAESAYKITDNRYLDRIDGDLWPRAQDVLALDTQVGTWSIAVEWGQPPTALGVLAANELACQMLMDIAGDENCALPARTVQVSRTGVTYNLADVITLLEKGGIGLQFCEMFIAAENPEHLSRPPRVLVPGAASPPRAQ